MITISLRDRGPVLSAAEMLDLAHSCQVTLAESHIRFLIKIGNGGYVEEDVALPTPVKGHPEFEVYQINGVGHPNKFLNLCELVQNYRTDDQLPDGFLPVLSDSGNVHIGYVSKPVDGCSLAYWSPVDGFPEKLFPVAVDFDDLCEKFFYCPVDRSPLTSWQRLRLWLSSL